MECVLCPWQPERCVNSNGGGCTRPALNLQSKDH